jgi:hypothetical protein
VGERASGDSTHGAIARHDAHDRELPAVKRHELAIAAAGYAKVRDVGEVVDVDRDADDAREHRSFKVS